MLPLNTFRVAVPVVVLGSFITWPSAAAVLTGFTPTTNCSVYESGQTVGSIACAIEQETTPDPVSGLLGVDIYAPGGILETVQPDVSLPGLDINITGGGNSIGSAFTGTIPVSWNFTVTVSNGSDFAWRGTFSIFDSNNPNGVVTVTEGHIAPGIFESPSGSTISGNDFIHLTDADVTGYSFSLAVMANAPAGTALTLDLPPGSLQIAASPEPQGIVSLGLGLVTIVFRKRAKRR